MEQRKSRVDEILEQQRKAEQQNEQRTENLKLACKEIAETKNGQYLLKFLYEISGWAEQDCNINNEVLIYKKARRDYWSIVRNIIPPNVLARIEIYNDIDSKE
ncbi:hypothetical protein IJD34_01030 [bacterium]|nr:hypothetical protein [bacterium]